MTTYTKGLMDDKKGLREKNGCMERIKKMVRVRDTDFMNCCCILPWWDWYMFVKGFPGALNYSSGSSVSFAHLVFSLSIFLSVFMFVCLSFSLSHCFVFCLSACLFVSLSICLCRYLPVSLSLFLFLLLFQFFLSLFPRNETRSINHIYNGSINKERAFSFALLPLRRASWCPFFLLTWTSLGYLLLPARRKGKTKAQRRRGRTRADSARAARRVRENLSPPPFCWLSGPRGCGQHFISMLHLQEDTGREGSLRVFVLAPLFRTEREISIFPKISTIFPFPCNLLAVPSGRDSAPNLYSWRGSAVAPLPAAIEGQGCMRCVLSDMQANKSGRRANNK